jgi:biotin operon repressor
MDTNDKKLKNNADTCTTMPTANVTPTEIRSFNKKLALDLQRKLKGKRPDITAAFVLGTLHTWKNSKRYPNMGNRVPGAVYLSVESICEDLPWLDRSTVFRAIERLEEAFPKDFTVSRESTKIMNFEISNNLTKRYFDPNRASKNKGSVHLSLHPFDAGKYGVLEALLIRNLEFKTRRDKVTNPLMDGMGRIYGEMNSTRLTKETKSADGSPLPPILPAGRQTVNTAIRFLKQCGVFVEHEERRGFYRVERERTGELDSQTIRESRVSPNATDLSSHATVLSSNTTKVSPDATVYSGQIEIDKNEGKREVESDKATAEPLQAARPVFHFHESNLEAFTEFYPTPDFSRDPLFAVESSISPFIEEISGSTNSEPPVNPPRFLKDEFPELLVQLQNEVQRLKTALKTPIEPVHPDLLPFDVIIDWERYSWIENELVLNPLTNRPIDWSDFDEQIDIAVDELKDESLFYSAHSKEDIRQFRQHFKRHEGLTVPMVKKMLERVSNVKDDPDFYPLKRGKYDHYYFARIISNLKTFNRYFEQLFRETFAPFLNERGEARFEQWQPVRWWPEGERNQAGDFDYPLCESPENMPEPFRSILAKDIEQERETLLRVEALQRTLQDGQDNGEIEMHPPDQDLLSGPEMDAFWSA